MRGGSLLVTILLWVGSAQSDIQGCPSNPGLKKCTDNETEKHMDHRNTYYSLRSSVWSHPDPQSSPSVNCNFRLTLLFIEVAYCIAIATSFMCMYVLLENKEMWMHRMEGNELRYMFLCLWPIFEFAGGVTAVFMHTDKDWRIVPFVNTIDCNELDFQIDNDASYRCVLWFLGISRICQGLGYFGFGPGNIYLVLSFVTPVLGYMWDQEYLMPFKIGKPAFPLPHEIVPTLALGMSFFILAMACECRKACRNGDTNFSVLVLTCPTIVGVAGIMTTLLAKSHFNQWVHSGAALMLVIGGLLQVYVWHDIPLIDFGYVTSLNRHGAGHYAS